MTDPENQLHAAGSRAKHGGFHHDKGCSNAFGDNPMRVLVPLLEFNHYRIQEDRNLVEIVAFKHGAQIK
jgi:hypothetical protein